MELEFGQLEERYGELRVRRPRWEKRLLESLGEIGQQVPIGIVAPGQDGQRYVVIDGYKRIRALKRLKQDTVKAAVWPMAEADALVARVLMREGPPQEALEDGWLLVKLRGPFGLSAAELSRRLGRSASWVSRRLALVAELPPSVQEHVRRGEIGSDAALKYLVPMARTSRGGCQRLCLGIAMARLSRREVGQLYEAWRASPASVRERLENEPLLFLRTQETAEPESSQREAVLRDLAIVEAVTRRLLRRLSADTWLLEQRKELEDRLRRTLSELTRVMDGQA